MQEDALQAEDKNVEEIEQEELAEAQKLEAERTRSLEDVVNNLNVEEKEDKEDDKSEEDSDDKDKEGSDPKEKQKEDEPKEEDGYYADESDVEDEAEEPETPVEQSNWLLDQLPDISVNGLQNGKVVSLNVKRADDLPLDFEFANKRDELIFNQAIADQTQRAYQALNKFEYDKQQSEAKRFNDQENRDIQTDIGALQREGKLSLFTPGVSVDEDPKAELAREVLSFYNQENAKRLQDSQQNNRLYHHLSYRDAFDLYQVRNPQPSEELKKEDEERKQITRRQSRAGRGTSSTKQQRVMAPRTASLEDIVNLLEV